MIMSSQVGLRQCKNKIGNTNCWLLPSPANVTNIPCNPVKRLCSPLFGLELKNSVNVSNCVSAHLPMCSTPLLLFNPLVWPIASASLHYEELWLPHQVWAVPGVKNSSPIELVECCTCCWRTRKYIPCWSTARLMHKPPRLCHDWGQKSFML